MKCYDGKTDVKVFLTRVSLVAAIKDYKQQNEETPQTFAYKILELVKLAYPTFEDNVRLTIAKDYYMKGMHMGMQVALKSWGNFETSDVHALAVETVRLELAGIKSYSSTAQASAASVNVVSENDGEVDIVDAVAEKVIEKLRISAAPDNMGYGPSDNASATTGSGANFAGQRTYNQSYRGQGNNRRNRGSQNRGRGGPPASFNNVKKCRSCQTIGHIVRDCPTRFCQACGQRGHDQWSSQCPNFA